jgi:hypothetical protein
MKADNREFLPLCPRKLISLRDMIPFPANVFFGTHILMDNTARAANAEVKRLGNDCVAGKEKRGEIAIILGMAEKVCKDYGLVVSENRLNQFKNRLVGFHHDCPYLIISNEIGAILQTMTEESAKQKFTFIPSVKAKFFEQEKLFDESVHSAFPEARQDIKDAGNCLAADLNTAAVFHLMRVVEYGLRVLAKDVGVTMSDEELEYAQWKAIIDRIYSKIKTLTDSASGSPKEKSEMREFYNGVLSEFSGFKDVWRNNIMHARRSYDESEALSVFNRVRDFMQKLAEYLCPKYK